MRRLSTSRSIAALLARIVESPVDVRDAYRSRPRLPPEPLSIDVLSIADVEKIRAAKEKRARRARKRLGNQGL